MLLLSSSMRKRLFRRSRFRLVRTGFDPKRARRPLTEPRTSHFQRRVKLTTMRFPEHRVRA
jgi:hypothetical protein